MSPCCQIELFSFLNSPSLSTLTPRSEGCAAAQILQHAHEQPEANNIPIPIIAGICGLLLHSAEVSK